MNYDSRISAYVGELEDGTKVIVEEDSYTSAKSDGVSDSDLDDPRFFDGDCDGVTLAKSADDLDEENSFYRVLFA